MAGVPTYSAQLSTILSRVQVDVPDFYNVPAAGVQHDASAQAGNFATTRHYSGHSMAAPAANLEPSGVCVSPMFDHQQPASLALMEAQSGPS
jgi:hypothetical protein